MQNNARDSCSKDSKGQYNVMGFSNASCGTISALVRTLVCGTIVQQIFGHHSSSTMRIQFLLSSVGCAAQDVERSIIVCRITSLKRQIKIPTVLEPQ
jgi:hypothetical protein